MDSRPRRSHSVTAAAVFAILASLFILLISSTGFFVMILRDIPNAYPEAPPFAKTEALVVLAIMMGLSLFGIATGIGLIFLRNWARISALIWGGFSVFFGAIGIPIAFLISLGPLPNAPDLPAESMQPVRLILLGVYGLPLALGIWWLILFNRKAIKAQFAGAVTLLDQSLPVKPRCPLPIAVLAWVYITSILNLPFLLFLPFRVPVLFFGRVLPARAGMVVLILSCLACAIVGVGLLKLKAWSYGMTIALNVFWLASSAASLLRPNYKFVMNSYLKDMRAALHLPETQFGLETFSRHPGWWLVLGLLWAGVILGLLVYYRPRFLEAASGAVRNA